MLLNSVVAGYTDTPTSISQIIDPSTGEVVGEYAEASLGAIDAAVENAYRAHHAWAAKRPEDRRRVLIDIAYAIRAEAEELARLEAADCGMPLTAAKVDIERAADTFEYFAGLIFDVNGKTYPTARGEIDYTMSAPYGVVVRIVAFNHPMWFAATCAAPLAMGNGVVVKPSEHTPVTAVRLGDIANRFLPGGLLSVVLGGRDVAERAVRHPLVRRVALIGSPGAGRAVIRAANEDKICNVSAELGGKNAFIVFPDIDVEKAADAAVRGMNFSTIAGQSCSSTSRVFAHAAIHDRLAEAVNRRLAKIVVGGALEPSIGMGPLITPEARDRVLNIVDHAVSDGATVGHGGGIPDRFKAGAFMQPTSLVGVTPTMAVAKQEIFGPVVSFLEWDDYDALVSAVNDVPYGLTANVWSQDLSKAQTLVQDLEVGYVWVNAANGGRYWGIPYGGFKDSGIGRESSIEELHSFVQVKNVRVNLAN